MSSAARLPAAAAAAATTTTTTDMHGCCCRWGRGGCLLVFLVFFVCLSVPHPLPPFLVFSPLPDSSQWTQWPCLQDPVLPSLLRPDQDWGDCRCPRTWPLGSWEEFGFWSTQAPVRSESRGRGGGLSDIGWVPTAACSVLCRPQRCGQHSGCLPCLSLGSEWPGKGTAQPPPHPAAEKQ